MSTHPVRGVAPADEGIRTADDILAFAVDAVDAVAPGERVAVIGASRGAYLAHLASRVTHGHPN